MRIQLDYDLKIIKLEKSVNIADLLEWVQKHLPNLDEWLLDTNTVIQNWTNPVIIEKPVQPVQPINPHPQSPPYPNKPWWEVFPPTCQYSTDGEIKGIYNLKIQ